MIRFVCPTCSKRLKAPIDGAGRKISCPKCGQRIEVPAPSPVPHTVLGRLEPAGAPAGSVSLRCDTCAEPFFVPPDLIGTGKPIRCPRCDGAVRGSPSAPPPVRREHAPASSPATTPAALIDDDADVESLMEEPMARKRTSATFVLVFASLTASAFLLLGIVAVWLSSARDHGSVPAVRQNEPDPDVFAPRGPRLTRSTSTSSSPPSGRDLFQGLACLGIVFLVGLPIYLIPTIIAFGRGHQNAPAICALNLLAGWTFVGLVGALVWALTEPRPKKPEVHIHHHRDS